MRSDPLLRHIGLLRRDAALRRSEGLFLAEGLHLAAEALRSGAQIEHVLVGPRLAEREEGRRLAAALELAGHVRIEVGDAVLDRLQDARSPQPVLLVVRRPAFTLDAVLAASIPLIVVCHGVQDPGNLGTVLRTAEAAGATGLLTAGPSADLHHPRAVRASMGSIFRLPALHTTLDELWPALARRRIVTLAADPARGVDYRTAVLAPPCALVFGGEGPGLPASIDARVGGHVRIPLAAGVESLSVGAAAAVLLFEVRRRAGDLSPSTPAGE